LRFLKLLFYKKALSNLVKVLQQINSMFTNASFRKDEFDKACSMFKEYG
jgi:hypothetical protein